jgi:iodothyronine deiodinase-like protein
VAVYVREAHPTDGWRMASNDKVGIAVQQPCTLEERVGVAAKCCTALEMNMPLLVDSLDDQVGHAYSGMPDRLYVIDRQGKVAYKGGRGPFGFKPGEMEQALIMLLLDEGAAGAPARSSASAWKHLPTSPGATWSSAAEPTSWSATSTRMVIRSLAIVLASPCGFSPL